MPGKLLAISAHVCRVRSLSELTTTFGDQPSSAMRWPMRGASRRPRSFKGRSWSESESSLHELFACRMIKRRFIAGIIAGPRAPGAGASSHTGHGRDGDTVEDFPGTWAAHHQTP